jgi:23S rRNA (cytosine1962-C5)-methyltransferase
MAQHRLLDSPDWESYQLLDSGGERKLERFGAYIFDRPEVRAVWKPALPATEWQAADAVFHMAQQSGEGRWEFRSQIEKRYPLQYKHLHFWVEVTRSRQLGVFPENAAHWDWIMQQIGGAGRAVNVLNLFAYSGLASVAAARAGASVTHVDASKRAVKLTGDNLALSGLEDAPVRRIVDDALKFTEREARRGVVYDGIIMDPPKYGLGPDKQRWEFFKLFPELCRACRDVLSEQPLFVVVTAYGLGAPPEELRPPLESMLRGLNGTLETGELVTREQSAGRILPNAIFARWEAGA